MWPSTRSGVSATSLKKRFLDSHTVRTKFSRHQDAFFGLFVCEGLPATTLWARTVMPLDLESPRKQVKNEHGGNVKHTDQNKGPEKLKGTSWI